MIDNTNGSQIRKNIKNTTNTGVFSSPSALGGSMTGINTQPSFQANNNPLSQFKPSTKNIPVNTPNVKQEMGEYFTDIPLEKEKLLREKLKAKYPEETGEQRFERAKAIVEKFSQEQQPQQQPKQQTQDTNIPNIQPITELSPETSQSLKAGLARGEKNKSLKFFDDINVIGKLTEKIDDLIQKIPVLSTKEYEEFAEKELGGLGKDLPAVPTMLANIPGSTLKTMTGILRAATNPAETLIGLKNLVGTEEGREVIKTRYGTPNGFYQAMTEDPTGVASDVLAVIEGGAGLTKGVAKGGAKVTTNVAPKLSTTLGNIGDVAGDIGRTAGAASDLGVRSLTTGINTLSSKLPTPLKVPVKLALAPTQPIKSIQEAAQKLPTIKKPKTKGVDSIDRLASNVYGLDAETVSTMRKNPELIKDIELGNLSKEGIKESLLNMVDDIEMQKGDIGKAYQGLYEKGNKFNAQDVLNDLQKNLTDNGVILDDSGKITGFDITNKALANTPQNELSLIKKQYNLVVDSIKNKKQLDIQQLHNIKRNLGSARYTEGVMTKKSPLLGEIANTVNNKLKDVEGWSDIDKLFSDKMKELRNISKLVETKQGEFKGTLKALLGERQYGRLQELEKVYPGLTDKLETLKAYDDYIRTRETKKVGLYGNIAKSLAGGGAGAGLGYKLGGQTGAVVGGFLGSMLTNNLTDPKLLKDFLIRNVDNGKGLVKKLETNKGLTPAEKLTIKKALEPKQTTDANIISDSGDTAMINNKLDMRGPETTKKGLQTQEVGVGGVKPKTELKQPGTNKTLKPKQTKNVTSDIINGNDTVDTKLLGGKVKKLESKKDTRLKDFEEEVKQIFKDTESIKKLSDGTQVDKLNKLNKEIEDLSKIYKKRKSDFYKKNPGVSGNSSEIDFMTSKEIQNMDDKIYEFKNLEYKIKGDTKERIKIKRELRKKGIKFNKDASLVELNKANKGLKPKPGLKDKRIETTYKIDIKPKASKVYDLVSEAKKYNDVNNFIETKLKEQTPAGTLKKYIGYEFDTINESVWKSRGNTLYIKFKRHNPGYLDRLNKQNFIESALEAGGDNILQIKLKKGLIEKNTKTELKDIRNKANKGLKPKQGLKPKK